MLLQIPALLTDDELQRAHTLLVDGPWVDGRGSAGPAFVHRAVLRQPWPARARKTPHRVLAARGGGAANVALAARGVLPGIDILPGKVDESSSQEKKSVAAPVLPAAAAAAAAAVPESAGLLPDALADLQANDYRKVCYLPAISPIAPVRHGHIGPPRRTGCCP